MHGLQERFTKQALDFWHSHLNYANCNCCKTALLENNSRMCGSNIYASIQLEPILCIIFAIFRLKDCWNDFLQILSWRNCIKSWEQKSTDRKLPSYDSCRRCNQSVSIFIFGTEDVITLFSLQFYIATKCSLWEQVQNGKMATKVYFSCEVKVYWGHHVLERGKHLLGKPNKWKKNKESKSWEKTLTKEWNNAGGWSKKDMLKRQWKNQSRVGKGKQRMEPKAEKVESRQNNVI